MRLVHANGALAPGSEGAPPSVVRLITRARRWWHELSEGQVDPTRIAEREGVTVTYVIRNVRVAFLSPRVIEGVLAGRVRAGVDVSALFRPENVAPDWEEQERRLLIA